MQNPPQPFCVFLVPAVGCRVPAAVVAAPTHSATCQDLWGRGGLVYGEDRVGNGGRDDQLGRSSRVAPGSSKAEGRGPEHSLHRQAQLWLDPTLVAVVVRQSEGVNHSVFSLKKICPHRIFIPESSFCYWNGFLKDLI